MSKEKKIDEITKDICPYHNEYGTCEKCKKDFEDVGEPCYFRGIANIIIKNGYRKQSDYESGGLVLTIDGATGYFPQEFIIEAIKTHMKQSEGEWEMCLYNSHCSCGKSEKVIRYKCSVCNRIAYPQPYGLKFCPNCGAKMKGGAE